MAIAVATLILAFILSYLFTPLVRHVAIRHDFVDRPDRFRKTQAQPIALGGGITLLIVTPLVVLAMASWWGWDLWSMARAPMSIVGLVAACLVLAVVGLVDDGFNLRGSWKLIWQIVAVCLVVGTGLDVPRLEILGYEIPLEHLGLLFTIAWLMGAINSFNLIDGVDGLAGSVGVVFSLTFGCIAFLSEQYLDAMIAFALAGSILGFLRYNFSPATIYLGDTGSMFIGLVLGTIALRCSMKQAAGLAVATPIAILSIPMFDALAAVVRRKLTGRSIYATDRGHIHHVLLTKGLSAPQTVAIISGLCVITSVAAVVSWYYHQEWLGIAVVLSVIGSLIATRVFGHVEFLLLNAQVFGLGRLVNPFIDKVNKGIQQSSMSLQGSRQWEELWGALIESAERFHVVRMRLNLSLPRIHEEFFASWTRSGHHQRELLWKTDIPLVVDGMAVGRLNVVGLQDAASASSEMSQFIDFVETLEVQLAALITTETTRGVLDYPETASDEPVVATEQQRIPATSQ